MATEKSYDLQESKSLDPVSFRDQVEKDKQEVVVFQDEIAPKDIGSVLKALFDKVRLDIGLTQDVQRNFIEFMINDTPEGAALSTDKRVQERASINKNFFQNSTMTWKKFVAAMKLLRLLRFRISVTAVHGNGKTTEHGLWIKLRDPDQYDQGSFEPVRQAVIRRADGTPQPAHHAWVHSGPIPAAPDSDMLKGLIKDYSSSDNKDGGVV